MSLETPEWLVRRGGRLQRGSDGRTWFVFFAEGPQYSLQAVPVAGRFGCQIRQTINGQLIPSSCRADTAEEALYAGLEELRQFLGW